MRPFTLAPSDFSFLWQDCPRCWWFKMHEGMRPPRDGMPSIFQMIDFQMKQGFSNKRLDFLGFPGRIVDTERWVTSAPVEIGEFSFKINGKYDARVLLDDGTYGVIDFKATEPKPKHVHLYANQLHSYLHALENPATEGDEIVVSKLALVCFSPGKEPLSVPETLDMPAAMFGPVTVLDVPIDRLAFRDLIQQVADRAALPTPPPPGEFCPFCNYQSQIAGFMRALRAEMGGAA